MALIRTSINYRNYVVGPGAGETIAVFTKDGHYKHVWFKGFMERDQAAALPSAIPVKLFAKGFCIDDDGMGQWHDLTVMQAIQGCWLEEQVWAITLQGIPRVVTRTVTST